MKIEEPLIPRFAEQESLEACLDLLKSRPLKLIAGDRRSAPVADAIQEIPWEQPEWQFSTEGDRVVKPVLLNGEDSFQFSLAGPAAKQDWHYHTRTYEIYVSTAPLHLDYRTPADSAQALDVQKGILIVPPGLVHKITLTGTTFVFQAMVGGTNLGEDKVIVPE